MSKFLRCALLASVVLSVAPAQTIYDIPVPLGTPDSDCLAFSGPGSFALVWPYLGVHRWVGLPGAPSHLAIPLTGPLAATDSAFRLNDTMAAYPSAGPDMLGGTADDALVLIAGLPETPTVIPTAITDFAGGYQRRRTLINANTVIESDLSAQLFRILRFDATGATIEILPSPVPFDHRGWGRVSDDALMLLGPGPDAVAQTGDDFVVLVQGLACGQPWVSGHPLPAGTVPARFAVTESGVGCCVQPAGLCQVLLTFVRTGAPLLSFDTLTLTLPTVGTGTWIPATCYLGTSFVVAGIGDSVMTGVDLEIGPDFGRSTALVTDVSATPSVIGTWTTNGMSGWSQQIGECEIAEFQCCSSGSFAVTRYFSGGSESLPPATIAEPEFLLKPRPETLVRISEGFPGSYQLTTEIEIIDDLWDTNVSTTLTLPGHPHTPVMLGPGMLAWTTDLPTGSGSPDLLRVLTLPTARQISPGVSAGFPALVNLVASPALPVPGTPETIQVTWPASWNAMAALAISTGREESAQALGPPFAPGTLRHLDLDGLSPELLPLSAVGGVAQIAIDPWGAPATLDLIAGHDFYLQAAVYDGSGSYHLSSAAMLILK